jgi:hypothetical protein
MDGDGKPVYPDLIYNNAVVPATPESWRAKLRFVFFVL